MPFFDIFRNLFGGNSQGPTDDGFADRRFYGDSFRNPIWQNDEDDDDIDDFRHPNRSGIHFKVFTDPLQITRYFESQMEDMMKDFFSGFGNNDPFALPGGPFMEALPNVPHQEESLRDKMLKQNQGLFSLPDGSTGKQDTDLDGKITPNEFGKVWGTPENPQAVQPYTSGQSISRSIRKEFYHRPDGTVEQRQIIRDGEGNEETIVTRQIGDKKYTISTKRDKNGIETKREDLINIDENELKNFTQQWPQQNDINPGRHSSILDQFFRGGPFGPFPKL